MKVMMKTNARPISSPFVIKSCRFIALQNWPTVFMSKFCTAELCSLISSAVMDEAIESYFLSLMSLPFIGIFSDLAI